MNERTPYDYRRLGITLDTRAEPLGSAFKGLWVLPLGIALIYLVPMLFH